MKIDILVILTVSCAKSVEDKAKYIAHFYPSFLVPIY